MRLHRNRRLRTLRKFYHRRWIWNSIDARLFLLSTSTLIPVNRRITVRWKYSEFSDGTRCPSTCARQCCKMIQLRYLPGVVSAWWEVGFVRSSCSRVRKRCRGSDQCRLVSTEALKLRRNSHTRGPLSVSHRQNNKLINPLVFERFVSKRNYVTLSDVDRTNSKWDSSSATFHLWNYIFD